MSITNRFKSILAGFGMLLLAFNVSAYPMLTFDGGMSYNSESKLLAVQGTLTRSQDINPVPQLLGSTFQFGGLFDSKSSNSFGTLATFTGISGPDLSVVGGDSTLLLQGELSGLAMGGANGSNTGALSALFNPTGGSLLSEFAVGAKLFALQLNLSTNFSSTMFDQGSFGGNVDGNLSAPASVSVPEPGVLILLILGLGGLFIATWKRKSSDRHSI